MRDAKGRFLPSEAKRLRDLDDQRVIDEFLVQVRKELAEVYARVDGQPRGGSRQIN